MNTNSISLHTTKELLTATFIEATAEVRYKCIPAQERTGTSFDHIRAEVWCDSGRIILFPALKVSQKRVEILCVQIICTEIEMEYAEAAKSNMNEDEFNTFTTELEQLMANVVMSNSELLRPYLVSIVDGFSGMTLT